MPRFIFSACLMRVPTPAMIEIFLDCGLCRSNPTRLSVARNPAESSST